MTHPDAATPAATPASPLAPLCSLALRLVASRRLAARDAADARAKVEEAHAWARSLLAVRGGAEAATIDGAAAEEQPQLPPLLSFDHTHQNQTPTQNQKAACLSRMLVGNARMLARLRVGPCEGYEGDLACDGDDEGDDDDEEAAVVCALVSGPLLLSPASSLRSAYLSQSALALSAALLTPAPTAASSAAGQVSRLVGGLLREALAPVAAAAEKDDANNNSNNKAAAALAALDALSAQPATSLLVLQGSWSALRAAIEATCASPTSGEDEQEDDDDEAWLAGGGGGGAARAAAEQAAGAVLRRALMPLLLQPLEARAATAWARSPAAAASWVPQVLAACTAAALDVHARLPQLLLLVPPSRSSSSSSSSSSPLLAGAAARACAGWATAVQGLATPSRGRREGGGGGRAAVPQELRQLCARQCVALRDGFMPPAAAAGGASR